MTHATIPRGVLRALRSSPSTSTRLAPGDIAPLVRGRCAHIVQSLADMARLTIAAGRKRETDMATVSAAVLSDARCPPLLRRSTAESAHTTQAEACVTGGAAGVRARRVAHLGADRRTVAAAAASTHPALRSAAAHHQRCPPAIAVRLSGDPHPSVRAASLTSCRNRFTAQRLGADSDGAVRAAAAASPAAALTLITRFAQSDNGAERTAAASNPGVAVGTLLSLLDDIDADVVAAAASNPALPREAILVCADGHTPDVQHISRFSARHISDAAPESGYSSERWAEHRRHGAAENPSAPQEMLERFATAEDPYDRAAAARNPAISPRLLDELSRDSDPVVRTAVAENVRTGAADIERLSRDDDIMVQREAARNPRAAASLIDRLARTLSEPFEVRQGAAANPSAPQRVIESAASSEDPWMRACAASNPSISSRTLDRLAADSDLMVREVAARLSRVQDWHF